MLPVSYPFPPPSVNVAVHGFNPSNAASDEAFVSFGYERQKNNTKHINSKSLMRKKLL